MEDFAKLFRIEGIGQILVLLMEDEEGDPVCRFRIPDVDGLTLEMNVAIRNIVDYDKAEAFAKQVFDSTTLENVEQVIKPLLESKKKLVG